MKLTDFYKPYKDKTGKVSLMRYCNNGLGYGIKLNHLDPNHKETQKIVKYYLIECPTLEASVLSIISEHDTPEQLKKAFYHNKSLTL